MAGRLQVRLPEYLPIVVSSAGMRAEVPHANRELPAAAGVSPEAVAMSLTALKKSGYVTQRAKEVRLSARGRKAREAMTSRHDALERDWEGRFGRGSVERLRAASRALLDDPLTGLPRYPLVLPRGGWPDGS